MVRLRNRYVVLEVIFKNPHQKVSKLNPGSLLRSVQKSIRDLHGIHGLAVSKSGLHASYLNPDTNMAFLRMRRSAYTIVSSALALVTSIESEPCCIRTLYTGATIRHCNIFLLKYQKRELEKKYASLTTDVQRKDFQAQLDKVKFTSIPLFKK